VDAAILGIGQQSQQMVGAGIIDAETDFPLRGVDGCLDQPVGAVGATPRPASA